MMDRVQQVKQLARLEAMQYRTTSTEETLALMGKADRLRRELQPNDVEEQDFNVWFHRYLREFDESDARGEL